MGNPHSRRPVRAHRSARKLPAAALALRLLVVWLALAPAGAVMAEELCRLQDASGAVVYTNAPPTGVCPGTAGQPAPARRHVAVRSAARPQRGERASEAAIDTAVARHSADYGVSDNLVRAVIAVESAGHRTAVSSKGAQGLMQLMPATARRFDVDNPFDTDQNIEGGVKYLSYLLGLYGGDMRLALAAYNAGEGAVERHGGVPPYPETRDYVRKVLNLMGEDGARSSRRRLSPGARGDDPLAVEMVRSGSGAILLQN